MKTYRLAPCPIYDIEGMQTWLEKMASKGLFLTQSIFFEAFKKEEPRNVRYRIAPLPKKSEAHEEAIAIVEASGWHYIKKSNDFAVYMTENRNAPELYSDIELPKETFNKLYKHARWHVLTAFFGILPFFIILYKNGLIHCATEVGMFFLIISEIAILSYFTKGIVDICFLKKTKKYMKEDRTIKHSSLKSFLYQTLHAVAITSLLLSILSFFFVDNISKNRKELVSYQEPLPFQTVSDLYPQATITPLDMDLTNINTLKVIKNDVCYEFIDYKEYVEVKKKDDDVSFSCHLDIRYYDLKYEWMANLLAKDIYQHDLKENNLNEYTKSVLPSNVKYAYYTFYDGFFNMIVVQNQQVMKIRIDNFNPDSKNKLTIEELIKIYAQAD